MSLSRNERLDLFRDLKNKGLKIKDISKELSCTSSLISQYFNFRCSISEDKEEKLIKIIDQARAFEYKKVYLD